MTMTVRWQDDRAELLIENDQRYALGDPAAPLLLLNAVDEHGCCWVAEEPEGWAAPEVVLPMNRRQDGHGGYSGEPTFEPRVLSFQGSVTAPSMEALLAARQRLLYAVLGSAPGFLRYTQMDDAPSKGLWVKPSGRPDWGAFDGRWADFAFTLVADDPIKTSEAQLLGPVRLPTAAGEGGYTMEAGGLTMPVTASGAGAASLTVLQVPNLGDELAHAIYTVNGPVPQPRIQLDTGQYVALDADLGELDTWVVDTAAGTSQVNGVNRYDAWGAGSVFPLIPGGSLDPATGEITGGGTEVRLRSGSGGADPAAGLTVLTSSSWK